MYNPAVFGQLAWDLGYGWGFSYLIGAYFDYSSPVAWSDTSLNQRFALSYTGNDWGITANVIWGIHMNSVTDRPQLSPCPIPVSVQFPTGLGCNPDFINVDLTVGHSFGKWQVAWVGDLNEPILGYAKQSQFAMGGLLGYDFGPVVLQGYLTTDVYEKNYGGHDVRGWARIVILTALARHSVRRLLRRWLKGEVICRRTASTVYGSWPNGRQGICRPRRDQTVLAEGQWKTLGNRVEQASQPRIRLRRAAGLATSSGSLAFLPLATSSGFISSPHRPRTA